MRWIPVALLAMALGGPAGLSAQAAVDVVFPGWRVYVAATDSTVSTHQTYHVALERAVNHAAATGEPMRIGLVGPVRITAAPVPVVTITDTVVVQLPPDTTVVRVELPDTTVGG